MNLKSEQQRLYSLMPKETRCFVRMCDQDTALWVSDLPRRRDDCTQTAKMLAAEGFKVWLDEKSRLWYVDWTEERWQELLAELPNNFPLLPSDETYHEVYALCRLWLLHPSAWEDEHLPALRKTLKWTAAQPGQMLRGVRFLHEEAALQLREGKTIAHAAGRILAAWLNEMENEKETKP